MANKKFVIKYVSCYCLAYDASFRPFRPHCQMDTEQAQEIWKSLQSAVSEIYDKNASVLSFEELYRFMFTTSCTTEQINFRNAYNLVLHKHGDLLYDGVQEMVKARLRSVHLQCLWYLIFL